MIKFILKYLEKNDLLLIVTPALKAQEVELSILKILLNKLQSVCVYVTVAKPYLTMMRVLKNQKINPENIFFIDCITPIGTGEDITRANNCVFCQPQALTKISITIMTALESIPDDVPKVLIFDTLSTLLLYNEEKRLGQFMHHILGRLNKYKAKSVIFTLEEETDPRTICRISEFCDKTIRVT